MKAMILAAGKGTRLTPLTDHTPKPLLPVRGKPLLHWQLDALQAAGVTDVVINVHQMADQFKVFLNAHSWTANIVLSQEDELLETGGGVLNALHHFNDAPFIILNGDIWTDFSFTSLPSSLPINSLAQLVLTPTPDWRAHGDFVCKDDRIIARGEPYCYCGIGVWSPDAFADLKPGRFSLRDVFFDLMTQGQLTCQLHHGIWHDIGTLEQYQALN